MYPPAEILVEMGRVAISAARVDRQLWSHSSSLRRSSDKQTLLDGAEQL
jgi:hypothetical protein